MKEKRWVGHVTQGLQGRSIGRGNLRELSLFEGIGIVGRIILKWFIKKWNEDWILFICLTKGTRGGLL